MSESLLRVSEILLFGRELFDIKLKDKVVDSEKTVPVNYRVVARTKKKIDVSAVHNEIDGVQLEQDDLVLVRKQDRDNSYHSENDVYKVGSDNKLTAENAAAGEVVKLKKSRKAWTVQIKSGDRRFKNAVANRKGGNNFLDNVWGGKDPRLARIYGFGFEGTYHEFESPTVFLVHGDGEEVTPDNKPGRHASRAPTEPSRSGVAAADFQFADDIHVWSYDKSDFTIRMDVETGMFEQVLLEAYFGTDGGAFVSGSKVSGSKVSGSKVSGSKVSGSKVSGSKLRGPGD
ncbi:MAG: hypothetical protein ACR2OJ_15450 [Hyphomicrobiales bacterium]